MKLSFIHAGRKYEATNEHASSSYGQPVLLVSGALTDVPVRFIADEPERPSALDLLAQAAGIWYGPATRRALHALAEEMLANTEKPRGADLDRVIDEFIRSGNKLRDDEEDTR